MIVIETVTISGRDFAHVRSDAGRMIERDGILYVEAYDPADLDEPRTYTESEELIPVEEPTEAEYAAAGRIMLGVE